MDWMDIELPQVGMGMAINDAEDGTMQGGVDYQNYKMKLKDELTFLV